MEGPVDGGLGVTATPSTHRGPSSCPQGGVHDDGLCGSASHTSRCSPASDPQGTNAPKVEGMQARGSEVILWPGALTGLGNPVSVRAGKAGEPLAGLCWRPGAGLIVASRWWDTDWSGPDPGLGYPCSNPSPGPDPGGHTQLGLKPCPRGSASSKLKPGGLFPGRPSTPWGGKALSLGHQAWREGARTTHRTDPRPASWAGGRGPMPTSLGSRRGHRSLSLWAPHPELKGRVILGARRPNRWGNKNPAPRAEVKPPAQ